MRAVDRVEVSPGIPFTLVFMWSIAIQLTGSIVGLTAFARLLTGPLLPSRQRLQDVRKDFELTRKADPASEARRIADTAFARNIQERLDKTAPYEALRAIGLMHVGEVGAIASLAACFIGLVAGWQSGIEAFLYLSGWAFVALTLMAGAAAVFENRRGKRHSTATTGKHAS